MLQELLAYVDVTAVRIQTETWAQVAALTSFKLDIIYSWLILNKLILNVQKSVFITFGNYADSVPASINLKINVHTISRVTSAKYLGLTYDYRMFILIK